MTKRWTTVAINKKIVEIEETASIQLPDRYKQLLRVVGKQLLTNNIPAGHATYAPELSIDELQQEAQEYIMAMLEDGEAVPHQLNQAFFILLHWNEVVAHYYWIEPLGQWDSPVYCWSVFDDGEQSIKLFS